MSKWHEAPALKQLLAEYNLAYPNRSKKADGSIGDTAHSKTKSDHNPNSEGCVTARDFTNDEGSAEALAEDLRDGRDPRVKYVIWNKRMFSSYPSKGVDAWTWRPYSGKNSHTAHAHVSVWADKAHDSRGWAFKAPSPKAGPTPKPAAPPAQAPAKRAIPAYTRLLKKGDAGGDVARLQRRLSELGYAVGIDRDFGPKTEAAVKHFQKHYKVTKLDADGKVGPKTHHALWG